MTASLAPATNPWEANARSAKAFALVEAVDQLCRDAGLDIYGDAHEVADLLESFPAEARRALAVGCGQRPPSDLTWSLVVARVRSRGPLGQRSRGVGRIVQALLAAAEQHGPSSLVGQELYLRATKEADRGRS